MTRRKQQPTADMMREQLVSAADEKIRILSERIEPPAIGLVFAAGMLAGTLLSWVASLGWLG